MFEIVKAAGWPIWPIIIASIIALAIMVERFMFLQRKKIHRTKTFEQLVRILESGDYLKDNQKLNFLNQTLSGQYFRSLIETLVNLPAKSAHNNRAHNRSRLEAVMVDGGVRVVYQLNHRLHTLGTIASVAPLMGLFGTLIGMIEIFGAGSVSASPQQLASGISVALYNTAFGLLVAIPSLLAYRYFKQKADLYSLEIESDANRLLQYMDDFIL
jgi:biopolymer transport protein ExbB